MAIATRDETAHREIRVDALARWRARFARQTLLNEVKGFERDQPVMPPLAERQFPARHFEISGIERIAQDLMGALVGDKSGSGFGEERVGLEEAFYFRFRVEATQRVAFQTFLYDRGDGFIADKMLATAGRFLIAVAPRRLKYPIPVHDAGAHSGDSLFGIFAAMLARKRRFDDFKDVVIGIVRKHTFRRFQFAARFRDGVTDDVVRPQRPREAVKVIDNDDGLSFAGFEKGQQCLDARAIRRLTGEVVTEHLHDLIAHAIRIFSARGLLAA